jgi:hypothetical protein
MTLYLRQVRNMRTFGTYILAGGRFRYEQIGLFYNPPVLFIIRLPVLVRP